MFEVELRSDGSAVLTPQTPFRLLPTVLAHGWADCYPFRFDFDTNTLYFVASGKHAPVVVEVKETQPRTSSRAALCVRVEPPESVSVGVELVGRVLNLSWELEGFYNRCQRDSRLRIIPEIGAGRLMRGTSLFEDVAKAISFTNMRWIQAAKVINRYTKELGDPVFVPQIGANLFLFPTAERIANAGIEPLKSAGLGYRAEYVLRLAERAACGELDFDFAERLPDPEFFEFLRGIKGVGVTTAHYLMVMYGRFSQVSVDSAVVAHLKRYHPRVEPTPRRIQAYYARKFGKFAALGWFAEVLLERLKNYNPALITGGVV